MKRYAQCLYAENEAEVWVLAAIAFTTFTNVGRALPYLRNSAEKEETEEELKDRCIKFADYISSKRCACGGSLRYQLKDGYELSAWPQCDVCRSKDKEREERLLPEREKDKERQQGLQHKVKRGRQDKASRQFFQTLSMGEAVAGKA